MRDSFNELSYEELISQRQELSKKYRELRFNMVIGHIDNSLEKRTLRRKIAALNTLIHEFDLGIRK
jgi:large subunit ribosomal protein L29